MNNPLISVIVPVYKVEKYLDRCVESIVNQTYTNLEIILVDDGSPDNCPAMCDAWAEKDSRIKVIHKENGGVSSARNAGLDISNGDFIAFLDSDDFVDLNMYSAFIECANKYNVHLVECSITRESPNGVVECWGNNDKKELMINSEESLKTIVSKIDLVCMHICNKFFAKNITNEIRFDENIKYNEDALFLFQVFSKVYSHVFLSEPMYHFYYNPESSTHNKIHEHIFDELKVTDYFYDNSLDELHEYCVRGDMLKTFNIIQELVLNNDLSKDEYKVLRNRVKKHKKTIFNSKIISKYTKIKTIGIIFFPFSFKKILKIHGIKDQKRIEKAYLYN